MRRADWLADVLRGAGCTVVEHPGARSRGRDFTNLRAVVWHHDASTHGDSPGVPAFMLAEMAAGRAGAQLWVDRRGTWHVLATGVAFHAGNVLAGKPSNNTSLGVETDHSTGERWPSPQLDSLRRGTAAILRHLEVSPALGLEFHKTICSPPGRKVDPDGLDLNFERAAVAQAMAQLGGDMDLTTDNLKQIGGAVWGNPLPHRDNKEPAIVVVVDALRAAQSANAGVQEVRAELASLREEVARIGQAQDRPVDDRLAAFERMVEEKLAALSITLRAEQ